MGGERIALLKKVDELGSIAQAAKTVGVSYKAAWEMIKQINNPAITTLVDRSTGGKGGGGASLTATGREVLQQFHVIQEEHERFLKNHDQRMGDTASLYRFLKEN